MYDCVTMQFQPFVPRSSAFWSPLPSCLTLSTIFMHLTGDISYWYCYRIGKIYLAEVVRWTLTLSTVLGHAAGSA